MSRRMRRASRETNLRSLRAVALVLCVPLSLWLSGCCTDVEKRYNSCLDRLAKAQSGLEMEDKRGKALAQALADAEKELEKYKNQTDYLTKRLEALGQKVSEVQSLSEEQREALAKELENTRRQLDELQRREAQANQRLAALRAILKQFEGLIKSGRIQVTIRDGRMVVVLASQVLFDSGRTVIKSEGRKAIEEITQVLQTVKDRKFQVAGHTDNTPIRAGRFKTNWDLSTARAVAVVDLMQSQGMPPAQLSAAGYGENSPVKNNDTAENRAENRRIEIVLQPNLDELPDLQDVFK